MGRCRDHGSFLRTAAAISSLFTSNCRDTGGRVASELRPRALCRMVASHRQGPEIVAGTVSGLHLRRLVQHVAGCRADRCRLGERDQGRFGSMRTRSMASRAILDPVFRPKDSHITLRPSYVSTVVRRSEPTVPPRRQQGPSARDSADFRSLGDPSKIRAVFPSMCSCSYHKRTRPARTRCLHAAYVLDDAEKGLRASQIRRELGVGHGRLHREVRPARLKDAVHRLRRRADGCILQCGYHLLVVWSRYEILISNQPTRMAGLRIECELGMLAVERRGRLAVDLHGFDKTIHLGMLLAPQNDLAECRRAGLKRAMAKLYPQFEAQMISSGRWFVCVKTGNGPDSHIGDFATEAEARDWISGPASRKNRSHSESSLGALFLSCHPTSATRFTH